MRILHLKLLAFGRFTNQSVRLQDGLNLICGENEAGKSTLHRFIRGMLFGFKREGTSRRYFTKEQEQYRPWSGKDYRGSMEFFDEGKRKILIERSFDPDETKVLDALTGKSLTTDFTMDSRREVLFAQELLGLNATVFDNTIFLAQLGGKTEKELGHEVADRLARVSSSGRDDLSAQQALADLKKQRDDMGSSRATTRPLGRAVQQCADLELEEKDAASRYASLREQMDRKSRLTEKQKMLRERSAELTSRLQRIRREQIAVAGRKVMALWQERKEALVKNEQVQEYADFPSNLREELLASMTRLDSLGDATADLEEHLKAVGVELEAINAAFQSFPPGVPFNSEAQRRMTLQLSRLMAGQERIQEEKVVLAALKERLERLANKLESRAHVGVLAKQMDALEEEDETVRMLQASRLPDEIHKAEQMTVQEQQHLKLGVGISGGAMAIAFGGAYIAFLQELPDVAAGLVGAALAALLYGSYRLITGQKRLAAIKEEQAALVDTYHQEQKQLHYLLERREAVLSAGGAESLRSGRQLAEEYSADEAQLQQLHNEHSAGCAELAQRSKQLQIEEEDLKNRIAKIVTDQPSTGLSEELLEACLMRMAEQQERAEVLERGVKEQQELLVKKRQLEKQQNQQADVRDQILTISGAGDWEEFLSGCAKRGQYEAEMERIQRLDLQLEPYLAKYTIDQWQAELAGHPADFGDIQADDGTAGELEQEIIGVDHHLHETDLELAALQAEMEQMLTGVRELAEIQEDLAAAQHKKQVLEDEANALDTAITALSMAADRRHRLLAPELNRRVGTIIEHLTGGRYHQVRIDEDLTVTVSAPDVGRQVELTALSAGTVDQFYFAVRVAMADLISQGRKLPLFLDDPFMQYSPNRLKRVLEYVGDLAKERQILLFTCRNQEQEMLDVLNIPYHRVDLSNE